MEEKSTNTKSRKRIVYYVIVGVSALLLIAGIVLTVYFVTAGSKPIAEKPPVIEDPDDPDEPDGPNEPGEPDNPDGPDDPTGPNEPEPGTPSGGESAKFVKPVDSEVYSVVYEQIYNNETLGWWYRHKAIDFDAAAGAEVCAMADGTVESVSYSKETGNLITIDHGDGLKTMYRFVEPLDTLKEGSKVTVGQKIATVAESYGSEAFQGTHLHLEVMLKGDFVDPAEYFAPVLDEK